MQKLIINRGILGVYQNRCKINCAIHVMTERERDLHKSSGAVGRIQSVPILMAKKYGNFFKNEKAVQ